ncbi:MAG: hypothetical protein Q4B01_03505, partial [Eubacteriales bacterium]|nr:hypothetical protein [Eubacteriales bacterium]
MHMSRIKATGKKCSAMMVAAALMLSTVTPANAEEMTETAAVETTAEETAAKLPEQTEAAVVEVPAEQPAAAEVPAE